MQTPVSCPVDHVIKEFKGDLQPVLEYLRNSYGSAIRDSKFPVGTITKNDQLDMCKQQLGVEGMTIIAAALQDNIKIKHALLGTNAFGNAGAIEIGTMLRMNNTIETVYLGCNYIETAGCEAICSALEENNTVKSLWLKRNPIGAESIPAIIRLLEKNKTIRTLDLVNVCVGDAIHELLDYLGTNNTLERLYLSGNYMSAANMIHVGKMLQHNKHLKALLLSVNNIGDEGVAALAPALEMNHSLKELSLASCGITDIGLELLTNAIADNPTLSRLDLGYSPSTRVLGAKVNQFTEKSAVGLMNLRHLDSINLTRTGLPAATRQLLIQHLSIPHVEIDGFPSKGVMEVHPDSKAIKSVYR